MPRHVILHRSRFTVSSGLCSEQFLTLGENFMGWSNGFIRGESKAENEAEEGEVVLPSMHKILKLGCFKGVLIFIPITLVMISFDFGF